MPQLLHNEVYCAGCTMPTPQIECEYVNIFGENGWACPDCRIMLNEVNSYVGEDEMGAEQTGAKVTATAPATESKVWTGSGVGPPKTTTPYVAPTPASTYTPPATYRACKHHLTPFKFGEYTIYLTGSTDTNSKAQADWPTAGVYLATSWLSDQIASSDGFDFESAGSPWPSMFIGWPDRGIVSMEILAPAMRWAKAKLEDGGRLEIACQGGHGRTGTFAVALMVATGMSVLEAFELIRADYCDKAVESREQGELLVRWGKLCQAS